MTVKVGCAINQQYPNNKFKTSSADDRKTEILPTYEAIFSTAIARRKKSFLDKMVLQQTQMQMFGVKFHSMIFLGVILLVMRIGSIQQK